MQYPLISEYVKSIQNAGDNLDQLSHLVPVLDTHGEPMRSSGAFAVVFKMLDPGIGKHYALKCFTEDQQGRAEAYRQIAAELEVVDSTYITPVRYLDKELWVDTTCADNELPVLLMDWVDGDTMEAYVAAHHADEYAMAMLCHRFCKMAAWLRAQPFAHGDVKPDNIMVRPDGSLTLVDYDGMYVPTMKGQKSPTLGTKDFSHPRRTADDFDEFSDDFALASIALSLKAMSLKPSLYDQYGASDRLLFSAADYLDISKSNVVAALQGLCYDDDIKTLMSLFLLVSAQKNLNMCSFRAFSIKSPNNSDAILKYGRNYCQGRNGYLIDKEKAFSIFVKASTQGNISADWCLGCCYENGYGTTRNLEESNSCYKKVFETYKRSAEQGDSECQWKLGVCYEFGNGVDKDYAKAIEWYIKSANQENLDGLWRLGFCYEKGYGVAKDYVKAVEWYRRAAELGNSNGQWRLGVCYEKGYGVAKDYVKAVEWYKRAAEQGNLTGQWMLGLCYYSGQGVSEDLVKAVKWFKEASERGDSEGQWRLGVCYECGYGVAKDHVKAVEWYRRAAELGNLNGQWRLGTCYENGYGVTLNLAAAKRWYQKAADKGHVKAKARLQYLNNINDLPF